MVYFDITQVFPNRDQTQRARGKRDGAEGSTTGSGPAVPKGSFLGQCWVDSFSSLEIVIPVPRPFSSVKESTLLVEPPATITLIDPSLLPSSPPSSPLLQRKFLGASHFKRRRRSRIATPESPPEEEEEGLLKRREGEGRGCSRRAAALGVVFNRGQRSRHVLRFGGSHHTAAANECLTRRDHRW